MSPPELKLVKQTLFNGHATINLLQDGVDYGELKDANAVQMSKWTADYEHALQLIHDVVIVVTYKRDHTIVHAYLSNMHPEDMFPTLVGEITIEEVT